MPSPEFIKIFRRSVFLVGLAIAGVFLVGFAGLAADLIPRRAIAAPPAAGPTAVPRAPLPFTNSLTINGVRVTLASIGHETVFKKDASGISLPVRCLEISYTVESLHPEPVTRWNDGPLQILINGQPDYTTEGYAMVEPAPDFSGGPSKIEVTNPDHATAHRVWLENDTLPGGTFADITIVAGPDDQHEEFHFGTIPLP